MRQRAAESDVVVVNHHLLCADSAVRQSEYGEVIPACPTLVVDEAHQLEDVATQYFGVAFSNLRVDDLVRDTERLLARGPLDGSDRADLQHDAREALARLVDASRTFFNEITFGRVAGPGGTGSRARYGAEAMGEHFESSLALADALDRLAVSLRPHEESGIRNQGSGLKPKESGSRNQAPGEPSVETDEAMAALERRAAQLRQDLLFLVRATDADFVYFLERRGRATLLRAAPIDVSRVVREAVLERFRSVVLTSATLAVDDSFDYVKGRLGIRGPDQLRVASEFDYARQALLYLPRRMPSPKSPAFGEAVARETVELLRRSEGRAFVLFTSYAVMYTVQRFVEMALPYAILVQGTAPRSALVDTFRRTPHAVLLGTASFWQGVDVAGDALSCVIIDKLPFASPGDPVTAARIDAIRAAGGDPFGDYQVPLAILLLQQGLGRLIRHRADRGVLAILDPRLRTMGYGRRFLASLPPAPVTHDLDAVKRFFK
jgi:ATP-dependent DNA helicase DinG